MAEAGIEAPRTVLVVDDHPVVRRIAHRLLTEAGFRAFEAASGDEAIAILESSPAGIDLVIVDVVLPLADGIQVTQRIQERWPSQRILYMSAHPAQVLAEYGLAELNVPFLAKPFTRDELVKKVREALSRISRSPQRSSR
jgi:two-component system, cell cycle sensor histidine kinase and response regulator CckA